MPLGVFAPVPSRDVVDCFFCFLREDSLPLRSEACAEPGRLTPYLLELPFEGVLFFDELAEPSALAFSSASFVSRASRSRSSSVLAESLWELC